MKRIIEIAAEDKTVKLHLIVEVESVELTSGEIMRKVEEVTDSLFSGLMNHFYTSRIRIKRP